MALTENMEYRLRENAKDGFYRALIEVVVEPSEVGLTAWDNQGRFIVVDPAQLRDYDLGNWAEEELRAIRERAQARLDSLAGLID